ncbi:MAG: MBL fold metallo-hydrolase [Cellvibrionales bacterium]|nr:MBL fold metallo-hydrolase [Cellvibrionales bacterium]
MPEFLHRIIPVTPFQQNCSLLVCNATKKAALVDPGGEPDKLLMLLKSLGADLEKIFLTHGHLDHVGAAKTLSEQMDVPIEGPHIADKFWLDGLPEYAEMMQFPKTDAFVPTRWLEEGDTLSFGDVTLEVLHCPGHTPGHLVFYHQVQQIAFVGDVIFQGSIGRTDFPQGNHGELISSIKNKLFPLGDEVAFVPGHGPMSTLGNEKRYNPFLQ